MPGPQHGKVAIITGGTANMGRMFAQSLASDGGGPARGGCVDRTKRRDNREEWDEDDDKAGDEGGLCSGGAGKAGGLELIAGGEEEADDESGEESVAVDMAKLAMVHDSQRDQGETHTDEVEEER